MVRAFNRFNVLRREYLLAVNRKKFLERIGHKQANYKIVRKSKYVKNFNIIKLNLEMPDLVMEAKDFQLKAGYFPISFSQFRGTANEPSNGNRKPLSKIIPGLPYSYDSYGKYLEEYETSTFAITHKKGGWDCYRHIEILESGCFPLMHDSRNIPEGSMFFYPKDLFASIYKNYMRGRILELESLRDYLEIWFAKYLTSEASIRNMLELSGINLDADTPKCLFVDLELHQKLDYLSAMALSGLMAQDSMETFILGQPPEYMFEDFKGDSSELYGRGFGYCRILNSKSRMTVETDSVDFKKYDFVVVGSASRNHVFLEENRENLKATNLIILDGADEPIGQEQLAWLKSFSNAKIFVRES